MTNDILRWVEMNFNENIVIWGQISLELTNLFIYWSHYSLVGSVLIRRKAMVRATGHTSK